MRNDHVPAIEARLPYLDTCDGPPVSYTDPGRRDSFTIAERAVRVANARSAEQPPSIEREGYLLLDWPSRISALPSVEEIETSYLPEVNQLLLELTGAARVFTFAPGLRFNERSEHTDSRPNSRPARRVHSDFSDNGTLDMVIGAFGQDGKPPERGHWRAYNVWRVLSPPPQDTALAFCDMRSIDPGEIETAQGILTLPHGEEARYEFCLYRYGPAHRWAYFPNMNRDEVVVFLGYDSRSPNLRVAHSAFDDPTCPSGVPPRVSIEARAVAYFPEEEAAACSS
jgi:hypothetical protein